MMDDFIEMDLQDMESGEQFTINISHADAVRAQTDLTFATTLLNVARQSCLQNEASLPSQHVSSFPIHSRNMRLENASLEKTPGVQLDASNCQTENDIDDESLLDGFRWSHAAVMLLIEEYKKQEKTMISGKITHKKAWDEVASIMKSNEYLVTGKQCSTQLNTMKRTYKAIKDHNGKSGNNKRTWQYFEIMESFLGEKPYMTPICTMSSTGAVIQNSRCTSISSESSSSSMNSCDSPHVSRKRKSNDSSAKYNNEIAQTIIKSRQIAEEAKTKRHKEKMEIKEKLLDRIDKLLEKI